jgi:hypothetical protein
MGADIGVGAGTDCGTGAEATYGPEAAGFAGMGLDFIRRLKNPTIRGINISTTPPTRKAAAPIIVLCHLALFEAISGL